MRTPFQVVAQCFGGGGGGLGRERPRVDRAGAGASASDRGPGARDFSRGGLGDARGRGRP